MRSLGISMLLSASSGGGAAANSVSAAGGGGEVGFVGGDRGRKLLLVVGLMGLMRFVGLMGDVGGDRGRNVWLVGLVGDVVVGGSVVGDVVVAGFVGGERVRNVLMVLLVVGLEEEEAIVVDSVWSLVFGKWEGEWLVK